ncbi:GroES-like protein [Trametes versicolor FP-101664 SS1]|uniref:GroES-like protein n=1 Tax=Trametes versicolor (strain FP-101664) TaxID=717944 RepID=UPI00046228E9|nr:GroES-like protein [Trametes versicolor FP-101664 SS1]EIW57181.1 GroES-like protein [Trametes versicolor FP-101664 SS1]
MAPTTQKSLILPEKQGQWLVGEQPVPTPGPKDILVKITATALNPVDWKIQAYGYFIENFPFVGGTDGAGIVEEVGSEVTNFAKGDTVVFQGWFENPKATFQQYAIVAAEIVAKVPKNITADQAASIPLGLATVVTGLYNHNPKAKTISFPAPWEEGGTTKFAGKPAFIIGGSSSVGQYAIQLAKLSGFSPVIATSSLRHEEFLKSIGAAHVIDRTLPAATIAAEVAKLTGGKPVEFVYDAVSLPDTQPLAYEVLAPGGHLLLVLPDSVPAEKKKEGDNKTIVTVFGNVQTPENREVGVALYSRLTEWLETGKLVPNRVEVLPNGLAGIIDGLERMKKDQVSGTKLVARPQETE